MIQTKRRNSVRRQGGKIVCKEDPIENPNGRKKQIAESRDNGQQAVEYVLADTGCGMLFVEKKKTEGE